MLKLMLKKNLKSCAEVLSQWRKCLPGICEVMSSIPSTNKKKKILNPKPSKMLQ